MVIILERNPGSKKWFYKYRKTYSQMETTRERIDFLEDCRKADIIPNFLRFRLPKNGCFDQKITHNYQMNLLRKNILNARETLKMQEQKLENTRNTLKEKAPEKCYHSIFFHAKIAKRNLIRESRERHNKKITFKTHDGYYTQKIGLAAGVPQASFLANAWLDKYENTIRNGSKIFLGTG